MWRGKKIDSNEFSCTATGLGREVGGWGVMKTHCFYFTGPPPLKPSRRRFEPRFCLRIRADARGRLNLRCKNIHSSRSSGSITLRRMVCELDESLTNRKIITSDSLLFFFFTYCWLNKGQQGASVYQYPPTIKYDC